MKKVVKSILEKNNLKLNKVKKVHLSDLDSPIDATYYNGKFGEEQIFSFDVPIKKCVNIYGYQFNLPSSHHFTATLLEYAKNNSQKFEDSKLNHFYKNFKPKDLNRLYFSYSNYKPVNYNSNSPLLSSDPKVITQPWLSDIISPTSIVKGKEISEEGLAYKEGSQSFGPVSEAKGKLEFSRLINTYKSIKSKGYVVDYFHNQISGYFIKSDNDYRFIIQNGNHRTASLAALGYDSIPVIFRHNYPRVIDINDVKLWPQVKNRNVTKCEAEAIFLTLFKGQDFSDILS